MSETVLAQKTARKQQINYWIIYTAAFAVMMLIALIPFWSEGRTLISAGDSTSEFYPATIYIGRWYRQVIGNFLHGDFTLPMFDPNIVLGEDAYGLMTYYNLGNPLFFLTALVPSRWMHLLFRLSIPVQYYLAGAAFSMYCFYMKRSRWGTLAGALVYLSCGYMFKTCAMYIDFLSPLIYLPLLLIGFEAVLQKKSVVPMVLVAWFVGLNEIYFSYMCGIFLVFYGLVRGGSMYGLRRIKEWFMGCFKAVCAFILGFVLAMPFLMPSIACFFSSGRSDSVPMGLSAFLPDPERIRGLLVGSWMLTEGPQNNNIALCGIAILAVILLVVRSRRRWPALCAGAVLIGAAYLLPVTDYLMNAFAGRYDRWVYLLAFVWALAVTYMFPQLLDLRPGDKLLLGGAVVLAFLYGVFGPEKLDLSVLASVAMLALTAAVLLVAQRGSGISRRLGSALVCGVILLNGALIGYWRYSPAGDGFAKNGHPMEYVEQSTKSAYSVFPQLAGQTGQNYRVDNRGPEINAAMLEQYPGINGYWSLLNGHLLEGLQEMGVMPPGWIIGLTGKSELVQDLLAVQYRITGAPEAQPGWQLVEQRDTAYLYEKTDALPIAGYTYSHVIPQESYDLLSPAEKQQMALQAIALEELPAGVPVISGAQIAAPLDYELEQENVALENGILDLAWWSGEMRLQCEVPANTRLLAEFRDVKAMQKGIRIEAVSGEVSSSFDPAEAGADYVLDLGYSSSERTEIALRFTASQDFEQAEDIAVGEIRLFAVPEEVTQKSVAALRENVLQDAVMGTNSVTGTIEMEQPGVLCIALPYSQGWTAQVDGMPAEILPGNTMFMALPLPAGPHSIALSYCTPGLRLGWILFGVGAVIFAAVLWQQRRAAKKAAAVQPEAEK